MGNDFQELLDLGAADLLATAGTTCSMTSPDGVTVAASVPCVFTPSSPAFNVEFGGPVTSYSAFMTLRKADIPAGVSLSPGVTRIICNDSAFRVIALSTSPLSSTISLQLSTV